MARQELDEAVRGRTIRFTWVGGPTAGTTHEHVFGADGRVTWRDVKNAPAPGNPKESADYAAVRVADHVCAVSYLSPAGYTLTAVLNFDDHSIVGFASGAKEWFPVRGTFEIVGQPPVARQ